MALGLLNQGFSFPVMLTILQRIFGRPKKTEIEVAPTVAVASEPTGVMPSVEVARLKLAAILERLPEELMPLVLKMPEADVTVALPVSTILKQLPSGAVKVSLATVHRQAPAGIFGPLPPGDRRLIDVPLSEVFRHISPQLLKRRADQRVADGLESEFSLFGNAEKPYELAPAETPPPAPRTIAPPPEFSVPRAVRPEPAAPPAPSAAPLQFSLARSPEIAPPDREETARPTAEEASMVVPLGPLSGGWPEAFRQELAVLNGSAQIALPKAQVTAGLARGRVSFTWGQIRGWLQPALPQPSTQDDATELTLPLKVIAPVFLNAPKKARAPSPIAFETDIPALFNDRRAESKPAEPSAPREVSAPAAAESVETAPRSEPTPIADPSPATVGDLFGVPGKTDWTPAELVAGLANRPGISGAIVALQEGLLVAHSLPPDVKSETIAAFLPQIFARLNQYSGEMKLGEVDDLLFTTHGAHCQIYRLGFVYFAVLGKPGESLPSNELRLVADELSRQTQPKS